MLSRFLFKLLTGTRWPIVSGELSVKGLARPVTIRRDAFGIPYIEAENDADAAFALGFVQGQDRAFQLETILRLVRGTLAELVGGAALPVDRLSRRIGFRRAAIEQLPVLTPEIRAFLESFASGVMAGSREGIKQWPHEFHLLKTTPTSWEPADVLAYVKFMSFQLPSNWDVELARFMMLKQDGPEAVTALDPVTLDAADVNVSGPTAGLNALLDELKALDAYAPRGGGSNNWVLDGTRTATGKPILASDPHLGPTLPNPWYLAQVRTPTWAVAGAVLAGSPVFPIGHNGHACWGVTAGLTDTTDLFLESFNADRTQVRQPDGTWVPCRIIHESIAVKGGETVVEEIVVTPRGPIVTPLIPEESQAISLQAIWLKPLPIEGFFTAALARTFDDFRQSFVAWPVLPLNVLYADASGVIGYQLVGNLPRRTGGRGLLPTPVAHGDWMPDLLVPQHEMPSQRGSPHGFMATANDDMHAWLERPPQRVTGFDFVDPYRAQVLREELAKAHDWTVDTCQKLHLNLRSKPWEEIREVVLALDPHDTMAREALTLLRDWNGEVSADSPAAAVFELFMATMARVVAMQKAPRCWMMALGGSGEGHFSHSLLADRRMRHLVRLILQQPKGWFEEGWPKTMDHALAEAVLALRQHAGPSAPYWAWGHRRTLTLRHALLGKHRLMKRIFNLGPIPFGGDSNTVQQAGSRPLNPLAETHTIPNMRTVFDTNNYENSRFALAGGQSGNPVSTHFADQLPHWLRGEGVPIHWNREAIVGRESIRAQVITELTDRLTGLDIVVGNATADVDKSRIFTNSARSETFT